MRAPYRNHFTPDAEYVARKPITLAGVRYDRGDRIDTSAVPVRTLRKLFDQRCIAYPNETPGAVMAPEAVAAEMAPPLPKAHQKPETPLLATTGPGRRPADERAAIEIPENWALLPWAQRRALGSRVSDTPVTNGIEVAAAIEAELIRRSGL